MSRYKVKKLALQTVIVIVAFALSTYGIIALFRYADEQAAKLPPCVPHTVKSVQLGVGGVNIELYYTTFTDGTAYTFQEPRNIPAVGQTQCMDYWE